MYFRLVVVVVVVVVVIVVLVTVLVVLLPVMGLISNAFLTRYSCGGWLSCDKLVSEMADGWVSYRKGDGSGVLFLWNKRRRGGGLVV